MSKDVQVQVLSPALRERLPQRWGQPTSDQNCEVSGRIKPRLHRTLEDVKGHFEKRAEKWYF